MSYILKNICERLLLYNFQILKTYYKPCCSINILHVEVITNPKWTLVVFIDISSCSLEYFSGRKLVATIKAFLHVWILMATNSSLPEILICWQINLLLTINNTSHHWSAWSLLNTVYPYYKSSLFLIPSCKWLNNYANIIAEKNISTSPFLFQRLWKLTVDIRKLKVVWYCKINFLTFNSFYAQRISKSITQQGQLHFSEMISH